MKAEKISSIVMYVLIAISVVVLLFCAIATPGSIVVSDGSTQSDPHIGTLLGLLYFLVGLTVIVTLVSAVISFAIEFKSDKKGAFVALGGVVALLLIMLITYAVADGSKVELIGYDGNENVGTPVKLTSMFINTSIILIVLCLLSILASPFIKRLK